MAIDKIVKTRKEHTCGLCGKLHPAGTKMMYMEGKDPVYDDIEVVGGATYEKQTGIKYWKVWYCYDDGLGSTLPPCS